MQKFENFFVALTAAWNAETTADPAWHPDNPALGQCAVTACVVQDFVGGEVVWAQATLPDTTRVSHYFNKVAGIELDLTRGQFPVGTEIPRGVAHTGDFSSTRDYVLSFPETKRRYDLLKERLAYFQSMLTSSPEGDM